jgi:hypothetical protein
VSDDRTLRELGIGAVPEEIAATRGGAEEPAAAARGAAGSGAVQAAEGMCQKADWLAPTTELPATGSPPPGEPRGDRLRRWGREYGGYVAAGALALVVLICAVAGLPGRLAITWHPGNPVAAYPPSPGAQSPSEVVPPSPSHTPSRKPTKHPAAASRPRAAASAARTPSPTPSPKMLGPSDSWALSGIVNDYCDRRFDRSAVLVRPWPGSGAVDNWACQRSRRRDDVIMANMTDACVVRYGKRAAARYLDAKDPFSWRCYR